MVSKASDDLPEPDRPVNTTSSSRGIETSMFLRLCSRAPRMVMLRASRWARRLSRGSFMTSMRFRRFLRGFSGEEGRDQGGRLFRRRAWLGLQDDWNVMRTRALRQPRTRRMPKSLGDNEPRPADRSARRILKPPPGASGFLIIILRY